jgi:hypothetical protein
MARRIRRALSFANVCSFLALTIALGTGGAYAANTVFSTDIVDGEVKHADLAGNSVTSTNIYNGSVLNAEIGDGAVDGSKILDAAIAQTDLANSSVGSSQIQTDAVGASEVADNSIDSGEIFNESLLASDLGSGSVGASELQDAAVGTAEITNNAITGAKVAGNTLTTADIAGADVNGGGISVPTGYVPNGRCRQLDANVGGAKAGEGVVFSIKAALQDGVVIYGQRVPSDGHVTFSVCNFSGATQAAISDMPVRVITFG